MKNSSEKEFSWVHEIGGRSTAVSHLCSLGFGATEIAQMQKRLSHWTAIGKLPGAAVRALVNDRGLAPGDLDVITKKEFDERQRRLNSIKPLFAKLVGFLESMQRAEAAK